MLTARELKAFLRAHDVRLSKRLGQHHLVDARTIARLIERCALTPRDTVVEIGAGLGALTEALARRAGRVIAVELDAAFCALLAERMRPFGNVAVVCQDILEFPWASTPGAKVVGAIPYSITSPLLVSLCESAAGIQEVWLLLQREVALRLTAAPGTKAYGRLSVLCQYRWQVSLTMRVAPRAFFPPPGVDSAWTRLIPHRRPPVTVPDDARLFAVVKAAFAQRRKTLANGLRQAGLASRAEAERLLAAQGLAASVRGETLSLEQFAVLANALDDS